jgi:iron complex transport system ATP-binding protein
VVAMHDLNLVSRFADRVALLEGGRLLRCGTPREVLTSKDLSSLFGHPMHVMPHPMYGYPLVLPDGEEHPTHNHPSASASKRRHTAGEDLRMGKKRG